MVYADDGTAQRVVDEAMVDRAAATWAGRPLSEAKKESVEEVDQWTVGGLRAQLPLNKYSWPDGQQVYVNGNTAEVVQYTTTRRVCGPTWVRFRTGSTSHRSESISRSGSRSWCGRR